MLIRLHLKMIVVISQEWSFFCELYYTYIAGWVHTEYAVAIGCTVAVLYAAYLCWQQPFRCTYTTVLCLLYVLLSGGIAMILMHFAVLNTGAKGTFGVILNLLAYFRFIETLLIFIHHLWKHVLQYYELIINIIIETSIKA